MALYKRAIGFNVSEVTEEYAGDKDGNVCLVKRKVVKKKVPPDVSAVKLLMLNDSQNSVKELTDEELEQEKQKLLKLLKEDGQDDG